MVNMYNQNNTDSIEFAGDYLVLLIMMGNSFRAKKLRTNVYHIYFYALL